MNTFVLLGLALQVGATAPSGILVRGDRGSKTVPVVNSVDGPRVRADLLVAPLGGTVRLLAGGRFTVDVAGRVVAFLDGAPFARVDDVMHPLAANPSVTEGKAWLPLHFVTEVFQRVSTGILYDPVYLELRQFAQGNAKTLVVAAAPSSSRTAKRGVSVTPSRRADTVPRPRPRLSGRHVIVVDAGHGGPDGGMSGVLPDGDRVREKDITLAVSSRLASVLKERGHEVVMTRTTDTLIALSDRGTIANRAQGDLFLSIHVNAANPRWADPAAARGVETYFLAAAKTDDARRVEQMENEAVRFETAATAAPGDPLSFVLSDMQQNEHLRESSDLAEIVQRELAGVHPGPSRGVKQAGFRVLVKAYMPAVLIEIGFGTNKAEAAFMSNPVQQRRMAEAIARAADAYLARHERRVGGAGL